MNQLYVPPDDRKLIKEIAFHLRLTHYLLALHIINKINKTK